MAHYPTLTYSTFKVQANGLPAELRVLPPLDVSTRGGRVPSFLGGRERVKRITIIIETFSPVYGNKSRNYIRICLSDQMPFSAQALLGASL